MIKRDLSEAVSNAIAGLGVSIALVVILRRVGLWDASPVLISSLFFLASIARAFVLRRVYRSLDHE